jgi:hypothetical protein
MKKKKNKFINQFPYIRMPSHLPDFIHHSGIISVELDDGTSQRIHIAGEFLELGRKQNRRFFFS